MFVQHNIQNGRRLGGATGASRSLFVIKDGELPLPLKLPIVDDRPSSSRFMSDAFSKRNLKRLRKFFIPLKEETHCSNLRSIDWTSLAAFEASDFAADSAFLVSATSLRSCHSLEAIHHRPQNLPTESGFDPHFDPAQVVCAAGLHLAGARRHPSIETLSFARFLSRSLANAALLGVLACRMLCMPVKCWNAHQFSQTSICISHRRRPRRSCDRTRLVIR